MARKQKPPAPLVTFWRFNSRRLACPYLAVDPVPGPARKYRGLLSDGSLRLRKLRWLDIDWKELVDSATTVKPGDVPAEFLKLVREHLWRRHRGPVARQPSPLAQAMQPMNEAVAQRVEAKRKEAKKKKKPRPRLSPEARQRHAEARQRVKQILASPRQPVRYEFTPPPADAVIRYGRVGNRYYAIADHGTKAIGPDGRVWAITLHVKAPNRSAGTIQILRMLPEHVHELEEVAKDKVPFDYMNRFHGFKWGRVVELYAGWEHRSERDSRDKELGGKPRFKAVWKGGKLCLK